MQLYQLYCEVSVLKYMQKRTMYKLYNTYNFERCSWKHFVMQYVYIMIISYLPFIPYAHIRGTCVHGLVRKDYILIYIQQDAKLHSLFYLETALHVSGGNITHHQERKQLYLQHMVFVTPLLLSAAIVEEAELV